MNGYNITAGLIQLGDPQTVTLNRGSTPGSLTVQYLSVYAGGGTFNLLPTDSITNFQIDAGTTTLNSVIAVSRLTLENGSTATTTSAGNITAGVDVLSGSTLNLVPT